MAEIQEGLLDKVQDAIRSGTVGKEVKRSAKWFHQKVRGLKGELRNRFSRTNAPRFYREAETKINPNLLHRRASLGDMYCYYYNPKHRDKLPYYDRFPMMMLISADQDTFLGLNFHYLRPKLRAILLDRVSAKIGGGLPRWNRLKKIPEIKRVVKRYRFDHVMKKVIPIEKDEQEIAIFLPLERFKKASPSRVWNA